uniref:Uncharacterized protein n=1 Tax=Arundo donax TaxID=35708 RepID=A0A0A9AV05_ARUDO
MLSPACMLIHCYFFTTIIALYSYKFMMVVP